ncbi:MAG: hypothetical protein KDC54_13085 [Lewinella sp.]|nr:hypothetical protein [Lewinella sp.]
MKQWMKLTASALSCILPLCLSGQEPVLPNPSFEGEPVHSTLPDGWANAGSDFESPPDLLPNNFFGPKPRAFAGETYLGMVARDDYSWEGVMAPLSTPLLAGQTYRLSATLARAEMYLSPSRSLVVVDNFNRPVRLLVWGLSEDSYERELLAITEPVRHPFWATYHFRLRPRARHTHLALTVGYAEGAMLPYNGNLLIDELLGPYPIAADQGAALYPAAPEYRYEDPPTDDAPPEISLALEELENLLCDLLSAIDWDADEYPISRKMIDVIYSEHEAPEALYYLHIARLYYELPGLTLVVDAPRRQLRPRLRHLEQLLEQISPEGLLIPVVSREAYSGGRLLDCASGNGLWIGTAE